MFWNAEKKFLEQRWKFAGGNPCSRFCAHLHEAKVSAKDCFRVQRSKWPYHNSKSLSGGLLSPCECFSVQKPENTNTDGKVCQLTRVPPHSNSRNLVVPEPLNSGPVGRLRTLLRLPTHVRTATWLILPVVICLSQRLSHACLSTSLTKVKPRMAH